MSRDKEYFRLYYANNRTRMRERQRDRYAKSKGPAFVKRVKRTVEENRKINAEYQRKYRANHKDKVAAANKKWYDKKGKIYSREYRRKNSKTN